ncbi:hypothetical protein HDU67_006171, partial [Dinochytrium kinnereticum]
MAVHHHRLVSLLLLALLALASIVHAAPHPVAAASPAPAPHKPHRLRTSHLRTSNLQVHVIDPVDPNLPEIRVVKLSHNMLRIFDMMPSFIRRIIKKLLIKHSIQIERESYPGESDQMPDASNLPLRIIRLPALKSFVDMLPEGIRGLVRQFLVKLEKKYSVRV